MLRGKVEHVRAERVVCEFVFGGASEHAGAVVLLKSVAGAPSVPQGVKDGGGDFGSDGGAEFGEEAANVGDVDA